MEVYVAVLPKQKHSVALRNKFWQKHEQKRPGRSLTVSLEHAMAGMSHSMTLLVYFERFTEQSIYVEQQANILDRKTAP